MTYLCVDLAIVKYWHCWVTLSLDVFFARALDIFSPHKTLHVVKLNLLIEYWSLRRHVFQDFTLHVPRLSSSFFWHQQWDLFGMHMKRRERGRREWVREGERETKTPQVKVHPCSYYMRRFLSKMTVWNTWPTKMNSRPGPSDSPK